MNKVAVTERLMRFEGIVPYMYRCTGGEVTVGIGHAIQTVDDAINLDWVGDYSVAADYAMVKEAPTGNYAAGYYENLTLCRMADKDIQELCESDIDLFEAQLKDALPNWDSYPENAQQALVDMGFNLGIAGLLKFPKMLAAVDADDWSEAANESHRNGIPDARNEEIFNLFLSCAEEDIA